MKWYEDTGRRTYVAAYRDEREARREMEAAARHGWEPHDSAATDGHVNFGRTLTKGVLTGGLGIALTGASRTKGKLTVTYTRPAPAGPTFDVVVEALPSGGFLGRNKAVAQMKVGELTARSTTEALEVLKRLPATIMHGAGEEQARATVAELQKVGATVRMEVVQHAP